MQGSPNGTVAPLSTMSFTLYMYFVPHALNSVPMVPLVMKLMQMVQMLPTQGTFGEHLASTIVGCHILIISFFVMHDDQGLGVYKFSLARLDTSLAMYMYVYYIMLTTSLFLW